MLLNVAREIIERGEVHVIGNLCKRQPWILQPFYDEWNGVTGDERHHRLTGYAMYGVRQISGRYVQLFCIIRHLSMGARSSRSQQIHERSHENSRAVALLFTFMQECMKMEKIINHCQQQTVQHLGTEKMPALMRTVTKTMYVIKKTLGILRRNGYDRVLVKADASSYAVMISRQEILYMLQWCSNEFYLDVLAVQIVCHFLRIRDDEDVSFPEVHRTIVIEEMSFPFCADDV